jgi:site-specific recombinase XerD
MDAPSKLTLAEFLVQWLETVEQDLKHTKLGLYQRLRAGFILPILGRVNLHDWRPSHIIPALAQWRKSDASSGTVLIAYHCLHLILTCAVKWGMLPQNPRQHPGAPKVKRKDSMVWTVGQARAFLAATEGDRYHALGSFLIGTGCRICEASAYLGERTVPSPAQLRCAFLRGYVKAGAEPCRLHDPRHLAATLHIVNGVDPKTVQEPLGHSSIQMTLNLCAITVTEKDYSASAVLEKDLVD